MTYGSYADSGESDGRALAQAVGAVAFGAFAGGVVAGFCEGASACMATVGCIGAGIVVAGAAANLGGYVGGSLYDAGASVICDVSSWW